MSKRRDRHSRGLRGPLATRSPLSGHVAPLTRRTPAAAYFAECVSAAVERVERQCPQALLGVSIGIEEVPVWSGSWTPERVPLAAAIERTEDEPARIVVYRRPLEHRAATRRGLGILTYRTIVEQLAAVTGLDVATIDPSGVSDEDDD